MKIQNKYDHLFENLVDRFSKIENFHLLNDDVNGQQLIKFITKRLAEIHSFKHLFIKYYIPSASRAVVEDLNDLNKSKYRHLIDTSKEEMKENYYDTIRLAYIGMVHKYESFIEELIIQGELFASRHNDSNISLEKYIEERFKFKLKSWKNSPTLNRLNWIANCNKHYDGFPKKIPKHPFYSYLPDDQKIKLTKEDFVTDIDLLISQYSVSLSMILCFAIFKIAFETIENDTEPVDSQFLQQMKDMEGRVTSIIKLATQDP